MGERQFGPYKLIRQIAVGGMAEIHLAKTGGIAGFEKYVALKMIHPNFAEDDQFIQMLVDEAKIAVQLTHGNIAQTFDLGRVGDTYYITMEYVDGADLYKTLRRASEQEREMPLDVCAFIGKEISSALDHAHRKRDHAGKSLGIVHRDVSPQNVLVSYSGEVKLVDFGIAKATMKVRQTAVGVIKGKYYYMSPEQAWGDPIDHRSDIFSAGIVLYEMITGQMLYLEEDLHKLLEMARSADIAPPSRLRRGVPPQLERIVMHALAKLPDERYQSAGDLATDLERFLHAYSPVFTASKLSALLRDVIGDPVQVPDDDSFQSIEFRDGVMSTHPLDDSEVAHAIDAEELRDENSVIFRMSELERRKTDPSAQPPPVPRAALAHASTAPSASSPSPSPASPARRPSPPPSVTNPPQRPSPLAASPARQVAPRVTRATDSLPQIAKAVPPSSSPSSSPLRPLASVRPAVPARIPPITKPRQPDEDTRQLEQSAPPDPLADDSGLLTTDGKKLVWDDNTDGGGDDELANIGERTLITAPPGMAGFMVDTGDDGYGQVEATLVTAAPTAPGLADQPDAAPDLAPDVARESPDEPARAARDPVRPAVSKRDEPHAAFAAKIQQPAVSELRKPRASRRTPPGGTPLSQPNVLQAIVASRPGEPMPSPRPAPPPPPPPPIPVPQFRPLDPPMPPLVSQPIQLQPTLVPVASPALSDPFTPQFPVGTPGGQPSYSTDASGLPLGLPTPPQPYFAMPAYPGMQQPPPPGYPPLAQQVFYPFPPAPELSSGPIRPYDPAESLSNVKLASGRQRWLTYVVSGVLAVSLAAAATFFIIRSMRERAPALASVRIESVPSGADVLFDGTRLPEKTPVTIPHAPLGTRHTIRVELAHYEPHQESIDIPAQGGEVAVMASLRVVTGKILIDSAPSNAEIRIDGTLRGRTPTTISDVDRESAKVLELRLKDYQPLVINLQEAAWSPDGKLKINVKLNR